MNTTLRYPRRRKRSIGNKVYYIKEPDLNRTRTMIRIHSSGTRIEKILAHLLRKNKISYSSGKNLFGNPDFILKNKKIAIFCDGDFWHGYKDRYLNIKKNSLFWRAKIARNIQRDKDVKRYLSKEGWQILRFWEHQIKEQPEVCIYKLRRYLEERDGRKK